MISMRMRGHALETSASWNKALESVLRNGVSLSGAIRVRLDIDSTYVFSLLGGDRRPAAAGQGGSFDRISLP